VRRLADWIEDVRYHLTVPAPAMFGQVGCLAGRTIACWRPAFESAIARLVAQTSGGCRCAFLQVAFFIGPVRIAAFATMFRKGWITRPDRPDLSAVRSSLLSDEPAPEIFTAMHGDHAS
jgi:hypothetical protein